MSKCPKGKVVNPKTGRCVKKDGTIGKKIVAKTPTRKVSRKSDKKPKRLSTPSKKPKQEMSDSIKSFKLYVLLDDKTPDTVTKVFQESLKVKYYKRQYTGLKDINVELVKTYPKYVVLEVTITAKKFNSDRFELLKNTMTSDVMVTAELRSYTTEQAFMKSSKRAKKTYVPSVTQQSRKKMTGPSKSFELYVLFDHHSLSQIIQDIQSKFDVKNWKRSKAYSGLKYIHVKLKKEYSNYAVLEVTIYAEDFEMSYFDKMKEIMQGSVYVSLDIRAYLTKQSSMK